MEKIVDSEIMWRPSDDMLENCKLTAFMRRLGLADFEALNKFSEDKPEAFWNELIKEVDFRFYEPYRKVLDDSKGAPWTKWCVGGKTNLVLNCLDKHRGTPTWDKTYLVWEGEDGRKRSVTYGELDAEVCRFAAALRDMGYGKGDVIGLYLPMLPESYAALFAIVKIGAIVLPLFSGFGPDAVTLRLNESDCKAVVTVDGTWRRGTEISMKKPLDAALKNVKTVKDVFVIRHLGDKIDTPMTAGRDIWWHDALEGKPKDVPTEIMDAEDICFLVFTSGTTGKPKGTLHSHCSLAVSTAEDLGLLMDLRDTDRMLWISDMGWLVGPLMAVSSSYHGCSVVLVEGTPDYPDSGRMWRLMQDHRVTYLGLAPTTIRSLMRYGDEVDSFDFSALRIIVSTGEPWTHDAWVWLFERVGKRRVPILNYSGGTEVGGGIVAGTVIHPLKPGCFAGSVPGCGAAVVDDKGNPVPVGQVGELVMTKPSIGLTRSLWRDDERYIESYWSMYGDKWRQGDWSMIDKDGMWYVLGRSDDTLNVSGKRTGPSEVEGALMGTGLVSEAAVIGLPDEIKGTAIGAVVVPMPGVEDNAELLGTLSNAVVEKMGKSYRPKEIIVVSDLPKTRNLKIMRRLVRAVLLGEPEGDLTSLVNPEAVDELRVKARG